MIEQFKIIELEIKRLLDLKDDLLLDYYTYGHCCLIKETNGYLKRKDPRECWDLNNLMHDEFKLVHPDKYKYLMYIND